MKKNPVLHQWIESPEHSLIFHRPIYKCVRCGLISHPIEGLTPEQTHNYDYMCDCDESIIIQTHLA